MSATRTHPRRRAQHTLDASCASPLLSVNPKVASDVSLPKGATFHASKLPSTSATDPVINVRGLPSRSPTSPHALEELVTSTQKLVLSHMPSKASDPKRLSQAEALPVPEFLVAHASLPDIPKKNTKYDAGFTPSSATAQNIHSHDSDSGIGSSLSSVSSRDDQPDTADRLHLCEPSTDSQENLLCANLPEREAARSRASVYSSRAVESSISSSKTEGQSLSANATSLIQERIITPLLNDDNQKDFHKLVRRLPSRIAEKKIVCLRDLEKSLIFLAPVSLSGTNPWGEVSLAKYLLSAIQSEAKSAASYFKFCVTSIDLIVHTVHHLNDRDLRQTSDRPYTNNYFVDLIEQVRQYAGIMAASRKKQAEGKPLEKEDYDMWVSSSEFSSLQTLIRSSDERLRLEGGMSVDGRPARLVREKDGQNLALDAEPMELAEDADDDPERSMARKRKCDIGKEVWHACRECGKQFKRPCDLTKHEKTHSRPFKCPQENCKYHILGWPTDKECERHFNDKHTSTPSLYHCLYEKCTYTSKRESNCKQHMEKTHGYDYVRSKSKKADRLVPFPAGQTPEQSALLTPSSAFQSISTPASMNSPHMGTINELSPPATDEGASPFNANMPVSAFESNAALMGGNFEGEFNFGDLPPTSHEMTPQTSNALGTPGSAGSMFGEGEPMLPADDAWNMRFDFGELAMEEGFPSPEEFFGQYDAQPMQQLTPAMSDFDLPKEPRSEEEKMTASAMQQNPMFNQQQDSLPSSALHGGDFSLFGEQGESSNMASMFADLNGNNQFQQNNTNLDFTDINNF